ncbi:UDP-glucuronosyl/UDP-glucosyltransferase [Artemisia annua]|uniref:Glycosyltransferase n=1 Tax=Artemisia annua TaxID=35608 RepID=A0A2U1MKC6_ARTAN|nr:UDP-glucuronosyl/UDP-glucosyltransferase [Artemisia annua]
MDHRNRVVVVMVPFVAHGHLNQLIHLSNLVSAHNIPVHFICTAAILHQARTRVHSLATNQINFYEFSTPPFRSPPPDPSIAFPSHLQSSFDSTLHLRQPVAELVISLSKKAARVVVIHDTLMSYVVQDVVVIGNVETFNFRPLSAFYYFWDFWEKLGRPFEVDETVYKKLPSQDGIATPEFKAFVRLQFPHMNNVVGDLLDSSRVIEGEYIEYLEKEEISGKKKIWAIGPFNPVQNESDVTVLENRHRCLQWLDKQSADSVIYVSFGTTTTFSKYQIRELAIGLEKSEKRFIWVVRAADVGDVVRFEDGSVELPDGFEEKVKGRGLVERGWAPQLEILGHFATGGFMTHCGWNSCMESISMGVPMATWPMHSDQPRNAVLITEVLGIGVAVKHWEHRDELVRDVVVKEAVEKLMGSKEGEEVRKSAAKLGDNIKKSMMEGGESRLEMDSFISYINR